MHIRAVQIELLRFEYSVHLLIEYSSTRPITAINYKVAQNERPPRSSNKLAIQQRFGLSGIMTECIKILIRLGCNLHNA